MKAFRFSLALALFLLAPFSSLLAAPEAGVKAMLVSDAPLPLIPGQAFTATVVLDLAPGWHTYWQYPGDSGIPTKVEWHLPSGWTAGPLEFSIPNQFSEPGDMVIYGYQKQQLLRTKITPPRDLPSTQKFDLTATVSWLACKELCVPGKAEVSCLVGNNPPPVFESTKSAHGTWTEGGAPPFPVSIFKKGSGDQASVLVSFTGERGASYELYPDPSLPLADDTIIGHVTQNNTGFVTSFTLPWQGKASFHALLVEKQNGVRKAWMIPQGIPTAATTAITPSKLLSIPHPASWGVLMAALFSGFLGGIILNLMPCVLPVISLKIFGFIAQAGASPAKIFRHGLAFAAGIFLWFLGLGVLVIVLKAGGMQVTWGAFQFQNPLFVIGLSVLVFLFALNLFGLFEVTLHGGATNKLDNKCTGGGYSGSFFQGLFATLLATPCTAPFLGSALGFAFSQNSVVILAMFTSVALGMSLPYLLLSAKPGWRCYIPKPGVWMERLKQFMGFPLLATNLWLLWVVQNQRGFEAVLTLLILFLFLGLCAWLYGAISQGGASKHRTLWLVLILLFASISVAFAAKRIWDGTPPDTTFSPREGIAWVHYSPTSLAALRDEGKPVLLDFTASWCLTCQFNERTAINVPTVRTLIVKRGVVAMKGDWTNADPTITAALKSFGRVGVPLVVYYPPGKAGQKSEPIVLPELLTESIVLQALGR